MIVVFTLLVVAVCVGLGVYDGWLLNQGRPGLLDEDRTRNSMRRIDSILNGEENVTQMHDVRILRDRIPILRSLNAITIQDLYEQYSEGWSAGWLIVDEGRIRDFESWLEAEVN